MLGVYTQVEVNAPQRNAFYGYMSKTHFLFSTAYSLMLAKKWFWHIIFYTDKKSWEHLQVLEELIDEVIFIPEGEIPKESKATWSIGKMWVFSQMDEPFVHIDNDAYLISPLIKILAEQNDLICHLKELRLLHGEGYQKQFDIIKNYDHSKLSAFSPDYRDEIVSYATGVFGGKNYKLSQEIYGEVMDFIKDQKPTEDLATALEQGYLAMYCKKHGIPVQEVLMENRFHIKCYNEMQRRGYVHLVGGLKKAKYQGEDLVRKYTEEFVLMNNLELYKKIMNSADNWGFNSKFTL